MEIGIAPCEAQQCTAASVNSNNNIQLPNMNSLRSTLTLPLDKMAIPIYNVPPSQEEVEVGGQVLFNTFVRDELLQEGLDDVLDDDDDVAAFGDIGLMGFQSMRSTSPSVASTPQGYKNIALLQVGANIRELADQFSKSKERPLIRRQADQVDLGSINQESFFRMLEEVFRNGINTQCIIALFFFCSDVLIRCLRREMKEIGLQLFLWSSKFVVERVCKWVYEHGGWARVLSNFWTGVKQAVAVAAGIVIIGCGVVYIKKNYY